MLEELGRFDGYKLTEIAVESAVVEPDEFRLSGAGQDLGGARRLVLATGLRDVFSDHRYGEFWGRGVYGCTFCHGWDARGQRAAVIGNDHQAATTALSLSALAAEIVIIGEGPAAFSPETGEAIRSVGIVYLDSMVKDVTRSPDGLITLDLAEGPSEFGSVFVRAAKEQHSTLAVTLGCILDEEHLVPVNRSYRTTVPGVFAVGEMAKVDGRRTSAMVVLAAGDGLQAGTSVHLDLAFSDAFGGTNPE